ncbi:amidohydrolase [Metallumcola ferriviriculae]|uniref:Amidohydrolase n=1 Tax=Metallumcola ferriviriculae TaxID=3039180 RepID=A0AAU0URN5_9FIRM|nr:amidohydrolase [Desulfitibacteraceae bacterium MK1]
MIGIAANIFTGEDFIEDGVVLIQDGKILEVGRNVRVPQAFQFIDARRKMLTPGFIDAHTHLGIMQEGINWQEADTNEVTEPVTAQVRVIDAINPADRGFRDAVASGITTVQVLPGSSNVICGVGSVVKTVGVTVEDMLLRQSSGLKVALGENPKREHGGRKKMPSTRMGTAALLRQYLQKARDYMRLKEKGEVKETDIQLEEISKALTGELPLRVHAHRADDIITALRIAAEFQVNVTIEHCTEGHKIVPQLKRAAISAAVGPTLSSRSKYELADLGWHTVKALADAAVPISLITDHPVVPIGYLPVCGALAVREGVSYKNALKALTSNAAAHLGVSHRIGSVKPGMDADLVIWGGVDPFHYTTRVDEVYVGGKRILPACE